MAFDGAYSPLTKQAARLLGKRIAGGRRQRHWSVGELAERVGVSRPTIAKVERGDLSVSIGTFFEAAALTGVTLFTEDGVAWQRAEREADLQLALLPKRIRRREADDDDF